MQHKLISIYMYNHDDADLGIKEPLAKELKEGWLVKSITPVGAGVGGGGYADNGYVAGWAFVVLEKP